MRTRILLVAATLAAFGASLGSSFHLDDYGIFRDPVLTSFSGWAQIWNPLHRRPLTDFTYWLNYQVGGQDPLGYHAVNLLLHIIAVLLALACLRRLLPERAAWLAATIFALHPLQAEAVNYVSARGIMLATVLYLAALLAWLEGRHWIAVAGFAAALLASPEVATFPLVLLFLDRKHRAPLAAMLLLGVAGFALAFSPGAYIQGGGVVILRYLRLLIVPYGFTIDPDVPVPALWLGALAWIAFLALAWLAWRRNWTWLLSGLLLLLPGCFFRGADAGDYHMHCALFGFGAAAGLLLSRAKAPAGLAVASVLALVSIGRTAVWRSDEALWLEAVRRAPQKIRPRVQLARTLRTAEALDVLAAARRMAPQDPRVSAETGRVLLAAGQAQAALEEFSHAVAADPNDAESFNGRGVAFATLGQTDAARSDFEHALQLDPGLAEAKENLQKLP